MTDRIPESARRDIDGEQYLHEDAVRKLLTDVVQDAFKQQWLRWVLIPFIGLVLLVSAMGYWIWTADKENDADLSAEGARATYTSCVDRGEGRFAVAVLGDDLRRLAVATDPATQTPEDRAQVKQFMQNTQPAVDRVLSDAVNRVVSTEGAIDESVIEPLREEVRASCKRQASRFDVDLGKLGLDDAGRRQQSAP